MVGTKSLQHFHKHKGTTSQTFKTDILAFKTDKLAF